MCIVVCLIFNSNWELGVKRLCMGSFLLSLFALVPLLWTTQALALSAFIPNDNSSNLTPVDVSAGTAGPLVSLGLSASPM